MAKNIAGEATKYQYFSDRIWLVLSRIDSATKTNKFDIKSIFSMKYQTSYDVELLISNF